MSLIRLLPAGFHAVADYAVAALLILVPLLVGGSTLAVATGVTVGIVVALVSALTRYPLGVVKVLPFTVHSAGDYLAVILLAGAPFALGYNSTDHGLAVFYEAAGLAVLAVSLVTNYQYSPKRAVSQQALAVQQPVPVQQTVRIQQAVPAYDVAAVHPAAGGYHLAPDQLAAPVHEAALADQERLAYEAWLAEQERLAREAALAEQVAQARLAEQERLAREAALADQVARARRTYQTALVQQNAEHQAPVVLQAAPGGQPESRAH